VAKFRVRETCRLFCRKINHLDKQAPTQCDQGCAMDHVCRAVEAVSGRGKPVRISPRMGLPVGLISGGLSGAFSMGGPPVVAFTYSQPWKKEQIVAVLQVVFGVSALLRLVCLGSAGLMSGPLVLAGLWSIVPLVVAILLGQKCFSRIPQAVLKEITFVFLGAMGLKYLFCP
jgi:uncharacterized membrane protein YfcA